jgi:parallel beta-helix repeat protein
MNITASNTVIDLRGDTLKDDILIEGSVENTVIRNGTVQGEIRMRAANAKALVERWNRTPEWTERIRAAAPHRIRLENLTIDSNAKGHQVYAGPGTTRLTMLGCTLIGKSAGPALYLSMEGGEHAIKRCLFNTETGMRREVIAIDGSRDSLIQGCTFKRCTYGGIYIYRNSGEDGTIRHQRPTGNVITRNRFDLSGMWWFGPLRDALLPEVPHGVILGSRQGGADYDNADKGHPWGSSADNRDFARGNTVEGNLFRGDWLNRWILDNDKGNTIKDNKEW